MAIATGQFTIIDYNDALTLTGYISSNLRKTQIISTDNGSRTPDWASTPLVLTPSLYKLGSSSDIITSTEVTAVAWYKVTTSEVAITADATHVYSGTKNHILTISSNDIGTSDAGFDLVCVVTYLDPSTSLNLTTKIPISFTKTVTGGGITDAIAWAPNGNVFKNAISPTLTAQCTLWRGSVEDLTSISYRWYENDSTVWSTTASAASSSGTSTVTLTSVSGVASGQLLKINGGNTYTISSVNTSTKVVTLSTTLSANVTSGTKIMRSTGDFDAGSGWRLLSDVANQVTGTATDTITIYADEVLNVANFLCIIKDTDSTSSTYNQLFRDSIAFSDQTDPYQITIISTGGDVFKNGSGTTTLTAKLYQGGAEVDAAGSKTYTWTIADKDGNVGTFASSPTGSSRTGKSITVTDADVTVKAIFTVTVS